MIGRRQKKQKSNRTSNENEWCRVLAVALFVVSVMSVDEASTVVQYVRRTVLVSFSTVVTGLIH
jgi:hypothetical protein